MAIEFPVRMSSPELNRVPPAYKSTGEPAGLDNLIKLPGSSARISRTDSVQRPSSDSTGRESMAKRAACSAVIKEWMSLERNRQQRLIHLVLGRDDL
jgi:hypothetical protein